MSYLSHNYDSSYNPSINPSNAPSISNAASVLSSPHNLSLKVMRISAPSLSTIDRPYFESNSSPRTSITHLNSLPNPSTITKQEKDGQSRITAIPSTSTSSDPKLDQARQALQQASRSEAVTNDDHLFNNASASGNGSQAGISTGRDWNISSTVVLPSSFGTIFLGETFSVYLCLNNESNVQVANATLKIEMQVGDTTSTPVQSNPNQPPSNQPTKILIGTVSSSSSSKSNPSSTESSKEVASTKGAESSLLSPSQKLETTVKHEMKELGPHVLVCSISYLVKIVNQDGQEQWIERDFRKFYKFSVPTSPLAVRTRATSQRSPNAIFSPQASLRERVFLDVSMENVGGRPLVLESLNLIAEDGWCWRSVDRPGIASKEQPEGEEIVLSNQDGEGDLWTGTSEYLLPNDTRQLLFILYPLSKNPVKPIPPLPLGLGGNLQQPNLITHQQQQSQISNPNNPRPSFPRSSTNQSSSYTPVATINIPLGKLDISWRTGMGEVGRLQTSTLNRRKPFTPAVSCHSEFNQTSHEAMQFNQSIRRNPSPSQPFRTQRQPSNLGPSASTPTQAPPPLPKDSPSISSTSSSPPPLLETELILTKTPKNFEVSVEEPFEIGFQVWIRDVNLLTTSTSTNQRRSLSSGPQMNNFRRASGTGSVISNGTVPGDSSDDSDDDRPLSEIASPRMSLRGLDSRTNSPDRKFSTASNSSNSGTNPYFLGSALSSLTNGNPNISGNKRRKLIIAVQFLSNDPQASKNSSETSIPQDGKPDLNITTNRKTLTSGLSRASTISGNGGSTTPLRDHRDPTTLSRSGSLSTTISTSSRSNVPNSPVSYLVRSSIDSSRTKSPPPTIQTPTSYQVRQPSTSSNNNGSRPSTPTQSLTTQMEGLRSQATSPNPILPPPPPPKNHPGIGLGPSPMTNQINNSPTKPSEQVLPLPYFDSSSRTSSGSSSNLPNDHIMHLGSSLIKLNPIILTSENNEKSGLGSGEARIEFKSKYLAVEEGMARLGGMRILLLGWKELEPVSESSKEDGEEKKEDEGVEWFKRPIPLREWETLAELWVD